MMATQPMNIVLITVTSMTSPSTRIPASDHDEPEQNANPEWWRRTVIGDADGELLS